jgi:large repetitive protein
MKLRFDAVAFATLACAASWADAQVSNIRPDSVAPAVAKHAYSVTFTPVNPYKGLPVLWNITGCLNGTGLTFTPQNGVASSASISGVPVLVGTFKCTIRVQDAGNNVFSRLYEIDIVRACTSPRITSDPPPPAIDPGVPFSYSIVATGRAPRTFSALGLPPGLAIDPVSGVIAGTTSAGGAYTVTVIVQNCGRPAIQNFTLVVGRAPVTLALSNTPNPAVFGQDIAVLVHASGGAGAPTGALSLCVIGAGEFCAAPVGTPPPGTAPGLIPALRTATLDASGNAVFTLSALPIQNYVLQAYYAGDATHAEARSVAVDQFVIKGPVFPPLKGASAGPRAPTAAPAQPVPALSPPLVVLLALALLAIGASAAGRTRGRG